MSGKNCGYFAIRQSAHSCRGTIVKDNATNRQLTIIITTKSTNKSSDIQALAKTNMPRPIMISNWGNTTNPPAQDAPNLAIADLARLCEGRNVFVSNGNKSGNTDLLFTGTEIMFTDNLPQSITTMLTLNMMGFATFLLVREHGF